MTVVRAVVVEDNALTRAIMVKALAANGVQAVEAANAEQGWKFIQLTNPQLIILDIMLPGTKDGIDLCRDIRGDSRFNEAIIVMASAADQDRVELLCREAGADLIIPKPFLPGDFWREIEALLEVRTRPAQQFRIFVLDDDQTDLDRVRAVLGREGYQVDGQTTVTGSIIAIKNFGPHLVLLDVMMPDISGEDLAKVIKKHRAITTPPKILYYSNKSAADLKALAQQTDVQGFVCKVDGPTALLQAVRQALVTA